MYYSIRTYSRGYYIGYAESDNGINWDRQDERAGIGLSKEGWDSENLSYPYIIDVAGGGANYALQWQWLWQKRIWLCGASQ